MNKMTEKFEEKIDEILAKREELANELGALMKMKEMHNILQQCKDEGHVGTLTNVQSDVLRVDRISLVCTRCGGKVDADVVYETGTIEYENLSQAEVEEMTGAKY